MACASTTLFARQGSSARAVQAAHKLLRSQGRCSRRCSHARGHDARCAGVAHKLHVDRIRRGPRHRANDIAQNTAWNRRSQPGSGRSRVHLLVAWGRCHMISRRRSGRHVQHKSRWARNVPCSARYAAAGKHQRKSRENWAQTPHARILAPSSATGKESNQVFKNLALSDCHGYFRVTHPQLAPIIDTAARAHPPRRVAVDHLHGVGELADGNRL